MERGIWGQFWGHFLVRTNYKLGRDTLLLNYIAKSTFATKSTRFQSHGKCTSAHSQSWLIQRGMGQVFSKYLVSFFSWQISWSFTQIRTAVSMHRTPYTIVQLSSSAYCKVYKMSFEYWWHFLGQLKEHQYSLPTEPDLQYDFHSGTEKDTSTSEGGVKMIYSSTQVASVINYIWAKLIWDSS